MNRKKILVVDDNKVILKAVSMQLTASGYEVLTAEDGSAALSTARYERPALILLDVGFPADVAHGGGVPWDGFRIIDWLRRGEEGWNIPFIIITGSQSPEIKERALAAGALAFFQKPVDNDELLSAIKRALEETEATAT